VTRARGDIRHLAIARFLGDHEAVSIDEVEVAGVPFTESTFGRSV
jgi:hypothetical protein